MGGLRRVWQHSLGLHIPEDSGRYAALGRRHETRLPLMPLLDPGEGAGSPGLLFVFLCAEADGEKGTDQDGTEILQSLWVCLA